MAGKHKIDIYRPKESINGYGDVKTLPEFVNSIWATKTEAGGRENLYAGRTTNANEVTFTFHWNSWIEPSMFIKFEGKMRNIISLQEEGFRKTLHAKITRTDAPYVDS